MKSYTEDQVLAAWDEERSRYRTALGTSMDAIDRAAFAAALSRILARSPVGLPVLRTCGECGWCGGLGAPSGRRWCNAPGSPEQMDVDSQPPNRVDVRAAPPPWCPLRSTPKPGGG